MAKISIELEKATRIAAVEVARKLAITNPSQETREAYTALRTAYGQWMIDNNAAQATRGGGRWSRAGERQAALRRAGL
jgi:hypothetical protein